MLSVWNKYDFTSRWAAAIGAMYQSYQFAAVDDSVRLPGFTRFDGAVYFNIAPRYRVQLNVENIFDRIYIQTADGNNNIQPGAPRTLRATLTVNL
jgi:catecholate siderophore receptor